MPLLDHFHGPLNKSIPWEGVHAAWTAFIANQLNTSILPPEFVAIPQVRHGSSVEVDVGTFHKQTVKLGGVSEAVLTAPEPTWQLPIELDSLDLFEVRVVARDDIRNLVAAIELISPANKDREANRQSFAGKCVGYLRQGVSVIVIDVVTSRLANLHLELTEMLELNGSAPLDSPLYAVAYRTNDEGGTCRLQIWAHTLSVGQRLPSLPLWITREVAVTLDLEAGYSDACRSLRIIA